MQFVYKPEGIEPRKWDFDTAKMMSPEAVAIERATKMTFGEWESAVGRGSVEALQALLWVMLKRSMPTLTYDQTPAFNLSELDFEMSDEESTEARATLEARLVAGDELAPQENALLESLRKSTPEPVAHAAALEAMDPKEAVPSS